MPKAKRSKIVSLSETKKKTKAHKALLFEKIQKCLKEYEYIYILRVENMRNIFLKEFRDHFKSSSKIFFGKNKLMVVALSQKGSLINSIKNAGEEYLESLKNFLSRICGNNIGLMFSSTSPEDLKLYLDQFSYTDYARAGSVATESIKFPSGPLMINDEPLSHTLESQLREAKMPVILRKGMLLLDAPYVICNEGDILTSDQSKLLKIFFIKMANFKITIDCYFHQNQTHFILNND